MAKKAGSVRSNLDPVVSDLTDLVRVREKESSQLAERARQWDPIRRSFSKAAGIDEEPGETDEEFYSRWVAEYVELARLLMASGLTSIRALLDPQTPGARFVASTLQALLDGEDPPTVGRKFRLGHASLRQLGLGVQVNLYLSELEEWTRKALFDPVLSDGLPAHQPEANAVHVRTDRDRPEDVVLNATEDFIKTLLVRLPPNQSITGPDLIDLYDKATDKPAHARSTLDYAHLRRIVVPKLKRLGLVNIPKTGYYFPARAWARVNR